MATKSKPADGCGNGRGVRGGGGFLSVFDRDAAVDVDGSRLTIRRMFSQISSSVKAIKETERV